MTYASSREIASEPFPFRQLVEKLRARSSLFSGSPVKLHFPLVFSLFIRHNIGKEQYGAD
jgi:hypothetical protein